MRSLGFYYKHMDESICPRINNTCPNLANSEFGNCPISDNEEAEIHCNLWKVQCKHSRFDIYKNPKYDFLLDIGVKFNFKIKTIALYFPFILSEDDIIDLGQTIVQDQELCCLIFNEDVITTHGEGCFNEIKFKSSGNSLWLYPIASTNISFEISKEEPKGCILHIRINSLPQITQTDNNIYIRFRIKLSEENLKNFKREELLSSDIIQSIFSKVEMFDFRINDKREINKKIDEYLRNEGYNTFRMTKVHFFLMCDTRNNIAGASMHFGRRFLETDKWNSYLKQPIPQNMIAYHWKDQTEKELLINSDKGFSLHGNTKLSDLLSWERKSFSNFRLFFIVTYPQRSIVQISFYCILAIILGAIGSVIATLFSSTTMASNLWGNISVTILLILAGALWLYLKCRSSVKFIK